jgi:endonuclease III related protein
MMPQKRRSANGFPRLYNCRMAQAALAKPAGDGFLDVYERLRRHRGPAGWWPAETRFEVCVGAILVQNTAWPNAEKALRSLRAAGRLSYDGLAGLGREELAALIRPSGCYNVKAQRLAAFVDFLGREFGGRVEAMAERDPRALRAQLLAVPGIGRETADSIALYAAGVPLFVIDAYTRRVFGRLGLVGGDEDYDALQDFFMSELAPDAALFNDYHAQIVLHAKEICRPRPHCGLCPLDFLCPKVGLSA